MFYNDLGIRVRSNNGIPEWATRGADTWSPFSSAGKYYKTEFSVLPTAPGNITMTLEKGEYYIIAVDSTSYFYNNKENVTISITNGGSISILYEKAFKDNGTNASNAGRLWTFAAKVVTYQDSVFTLTSSNFGSNVKNYAVISAIKIK